MKIQLGETLKKLRNERGLTQGELAQAFSVTPQSISRWENGQSYPDIEQLPQIADYFDVTVDELMGRDSRTKQKLEDELRKLRGNGGYEDLMSRRKMRDILEKLAKAYPSEYCVDFFRESVKLRRDGFIYERDVEEAREICRQALRECTDEGRPMLLTRIVMHEDADMLAQWKHFITSDVNRATWNDILLTRYFAVREENHLWEKQMRKVLYDHIHAAVWTMANDKPGECQMINSRKAGFLNDEAHYRKILALIDLFDDGRDEDFLEESFQESLMERIFVKVRLMAVLVDSGKIDDGAELIPEMREHLRLLLKKSQGKGVSAATEVKLAEMRREFDSVRSDRRFAEFFTFAASVSNPKGRGVMIPQDNSDEDFDIEGFLPLLETARKISDEERAGEGENHDPDRCATVVVLEAVSGKIYTTVVHDVNDDCDEKALLSTLKDNDDTHIARIVCMWIESGAVDMFRIAGEIARLDKRNHSAEIILSGAERYFKRTLGQVYGNKIFK